MKGDEFVFEELGVPAPRFEMRECVRRFAELHELHHTCPGICERCAFELVGSMLLAEWERENPR